MKITYSFFKIFFLYFLITFFSSIQAFSQGKKIAEDETFHEKSIEKLSQQKIGTKLPIIIADGLNGEIFNSDQTKKTAFYYFWYTDCGDACSAQLPLLNELQHLYKDTVDFIAITYDNKTKITEFLESNTFNFKQYMMPQNQTEIMRITYGYPTTIIVVDGIIKYWSPGGAVNPESINKLRNNYKELLNINPTK